MLIVTDVCRNIQLKLVNVDNYLKFTQYLDNKQISVNDNTMILVNVTNKICFR